MFTPQDELYMQRALQLAALGRFSTSPNPRVGCVIVRGGQIVGEGFHVKAGAPHAEVHALAQAGELARGATAYVTLEPCAHFGRTPPCALALINAGVARVVAAMTDPNPLVAGKGLAMLREAGIAAESGLLESEARALNRGFLSRIERGRPFVRAKIGMSLDGKTALANGQSKWITGQVARDDVQYLRAESCAILTGIETVIADNPQLNVRLFETLRQPIRVVLDSRFRLPSVQIFNLGNRSASSEVGLPENAKLVQDGAATWLFTCSQEHKTLPENVRVFRQLENKTGKLDLANVLQILAQEGIGELMIEAGATLTSAFLAQDLVDELVVYQAPKILGETARQAFRLPENAAALGETLRWKTQSVEQIGDDVKWVLQKV
ncbi:bifunctional diaminohydroxyphosphoribosylaminopyrimidine deaminase/5-amino-6-(5-phosphoribosylamino)uracil reductase RibD [Neisseriaceae bacterium B1]